MRRYVLLTRAWTKNGPNGVDWKQKDLADSAEELQVMLSTIINRLVKAIKAAKVGETDIIATIGLDVWAANGEKTEGQGELPF